MGKVISELGEKERYFIENQKVFFVATAPSSIDHHVNVSPKAKGCIVLDSDTVAYADLTGSGAETAAHILQNGRMTLMFCNLEDGPPKILRLFGMAEVLPADQVPNTLLAKFPNDITTSYGFRAIYKLKVSRISSSCGYSLPVMEFNKYRKTLDEFTQGQGKEKMFDYITMKNSYSIDGLPSVAHLRNNAPANIQPVHKDGYVFGEVNNTLDPSSIQKSKLPFPSKRFPFLMRRLFHGFSSISTISAFSTFIFGVIIGIFISTHVIKQRFSPEL